MKQASIISFMKRPAATPAEESTPVKATKVECRPEKDDPGVPRCDADDSAGVAEAAFAAPVDEEDLPENEYER